MASQHEYCAYKTGIKRESGSSFPTRATHKSVKIPSRVLKPRWKKIGYETQESVKTKKSRVIIYKSVDRVRVLKQKSHRTEDRIRVRIMGGA